MATTEEAITALEIARAVIREQDALQDAPAQEQPPADAPLPDRWSGDIAFEGVRTSDDREIAPNALSWRALPIPLLWLTGESHGGLPIAPSVVVGKIEAIERVGEALHATGSFDLGSNDGKEAARLVRDGIVTGISIDVSVIDFEVIEEGDCSEAGLILIGQGDAPEAPAADGEPCHIIERLLDGEIMGATIVPFPAFVDARITAEGPVAASALSASERRYLAAFGPTGKPVTDDEWDGSAGRFTDEQYQMSSAACEQGDGTVKQRCFLPHHEPDGRINRNGVHASAQRFAALQRPADAKATAAGHLRSHYTTDLDEDVPDVIAASVAEAEALVASAYIAAAPEGVWRFAAVAPLAPALVAPLVPPADWFTDPQLPELQRFVTLTDEGEVMGHLAGWGECHIGHQGKCVPVPSSSHDYAYFRVGVIDTDDGPVAVGALTLSGGHADTLDSVSDAQRYYDDTDSAVAYVAVGEDEFGIWFHGTLRPDAPPEHVYRLKAHGVSGDWRWIAGALELIAACCVNTPGFPKVAARVASGRVVALVAAGGRPRAAPEVCGCGWQDRLIAVEAKATQALYLITQARAVVAEGLLARINAQ